MYVWDDREKDLWIIMLISPKEERKPELFVEVVVVWSLKKMYTMGAANLIDQLVSNHLVVAGAAAAGAITSFAVSVASTTITPPFYSY